jgi:Transposase Tn5 dimerisation domain
VVLVTCNEAGVEGPDVVHHADPHSPTKLPALREATRRVAMRGGFLGRNGDGEPGTQTLWLGLQRLDDIVTTWRIMTKATQPRVQGARFWVKIRPKAGISY